MSKDRLRLLALSAAAVVALAALAGCAGTDQESTNGNGNGNGNDGDDANNVPANPTPGLDDSLNETGNSSMNETMAMPP